MMRFDYYGKRSADYDVDGLSAEAVDTFFAYVKKNRLKLEGLKIRDLIEEGRRY
jgi:hypothetical protein